MWKKFEIYSIKKNSISQKRPCVLRDFVPRGVFLQSSGGRVLNINHFICTNYCLPSLASSPCPWHGAYGKRILPSAPQIVKRAGSWTTSLGLYLESVYDLTQSTLLQLPVVRGIIQFDDVTLFFS